MDAPDAFSPSVGPPRILVIDDEIPFLKTFARALHPCVVEVASSGALALARLATLPAFNLVLCDLYLRDLNGRDLYRLACARSPELRHRFVFMTGDRATLPPPPRDDDSGAVRVLCKPFDNAVVRAVVFGLVRRLPPRAEPEPASMAAPIATPLPPSVGPARILVVARESALLQTFHGLLHPHVVELASRGALALWRFAALPAFDAVLCDLHLADLEGPDLYRLACARFPELRGRFVFMTDDRSRPPHGLMDDSGAVRVLSRPFEPELLHAVLRDLLTRLPPRPET